MKMDPTCGFHHLRPGFWADGPHLQHSSSGTIDLQRKVGSSRSVYTHMSFRSYFLRILGLSSFQNCLCGAWRFLSLCSTFSKGELYALHPSSTYVHFISLCLINEDLFVPIWCKIVWNRSAKTDSDQATLDARIGRASLLFRTPLDLFGFRRNGIYLPQNRATLMVCADAQDSVFRSSLLASAVPCTTHPPFLEGTRTAGCLLYHTSLKISHQNNRQQNNFCKMFLS